MAPTAECRHDRGMNELIGRRMMGHAAFIDHTVRATDAAARADCVVTYWGEDNSPQDGHEHCTLETVARSLAELKGCRFADRYDTAERYGGRLYFVPRDTLLTADARRLSIAREEDLFGGVVSHPFVATKTITHPLFDAQARAPLGWSQRFPERILEEALAGYSAFAREDARRAGMHMLRAGPVRLKPATGIGGAGQQTVYDPRQLDAALEAMNASDGLQHGLVLEQNLTDVTTYSVGQVNAAGILISYYGTQRLTRNHDGREVYGGSDLFVARGVFDDLLAIAPDRRVALAIRQAMRYDAAARAEFPALVASRRNYDIAQGLDARGYRRSGVLEQSWRAGGATPAELQAMRAFRDDPSLNVISASSVEVYGDIEPPPGAEVIFRGNDPRAGAILKYSTVRTHGIVP